MAKQIYSIGTISKACFVGLFLVLFCLPTIQRNFRLFPVVALSDVNTRVAAPNCTFKTFVKGRCQRTIDDWLLRGSGLWGSFVSLSNTINYSLFDVAPPGYGGVVTIGKDKALFNSMSVNDLNGRYFSDANKVYMLLDKAKALQERLAQEGTPFLLVISPNKLLLHPEWMRQGLLSPKPGPRLFEQIRPLLIEKGIYHVVLTEELAASSEYRGHKFFPKSGAHMNKLGTCIAARSIARELNKQKPGLLPQVDCGAVIGMAAPSADDRDLARIINVFTARYSLDQQPVIEPRVLGAGSLTNTLFVGTSNLFGFIGTLRDLGMLSKRDYYFYSRNLYSCSEKRVDGTQDCLRRPIRKKADYSPLILANRSAVILETPEARVHQMGFGFLEKLQKDTPQ
jgi:hypothetical protein